MHPHFEAHTTHADRFTHILLAVDDEFLGKDMQDLLVHRNVDCARGFNHAINIELRHFLVLDRHHAVRVETFDMRAGNAGQHVANLAIGHQLGLFQCALNAVDRRFNIDDHALLQPF